MSYNHNEKVVRVKERIATIGWLAQSGCRLLDLLFKCPPHLPSKYLTIIYSVNVISRWQYQFLQLCYKFVSIIQSVSTMLV